MAISVWYNSLEITGESFEVSIRRGRSRELDEFEAASGYVKVRNYARNFDPPFFSTPSYLLLESGDFLLLENGDRIMLEQGSAASGAYGSMTLGAPFEVRDGAVVVFSGHVEDIRYEWTREGEATATFIVGDALSALAACEFQTEWQAAEEKPTVRINAVLDQIAGFPSGATYRDISTGHSILIGDLVENGTNVLTYLQLVARSDFGKLYSNRLGKLVYKGRYNWPGESGGTFGNVSADFKDDGTAFGFSHVRVDWGSELLVYQASVSRIVVLPEAVDFGVAAPSTTIEQATADSGGTPRTATSALTPPTRIGSRSISIDGLLLRHDAECEARAQYIVDRFSSPEAVVSELTTILNNEGTADRATIAALDINEVITLTWTPTGTGSIVTQTLAIEGVTYDHTVSGLATVTFQLSAMPDTNFFTLDTDSLDSGVLWGF